MLKIPVCAWRLGRACWAPAAGPSLGLAPGEGWTQVGPGVELPSQHGASKEEHLRGYSELLGFNACLKVATSLMSLSVFVFAGRRAVGVPASFQGFCVPPPAGVDDAAAAAEAVPALRVPAGQ